MNKIRKDKEFSFNTHLISELQVDLCRGNRHPFSIRPLIVGLPTWFLVVKTPPGNAGDLEMPVRSLGRGDPLEEGMATHSSMLAWRIPRTEEPDRVQCPGSHRVRHD